MDSKIQPNRITLNQEWFLAILDTNGITKNKKLDSPIQNKHSIPWNPFYVIISFFSKPFYHGKKKKKKSIATL